MALSRSRGKVAKLGPGGWIYAGKYGPERYLYFLQRLSGLGLLLYLFMHLILTATRISGPAAWEKAMAMVAGPWFKLGEYLVFAAFTFHGLNGLRLVIIELGWAIGKPSRQDYPYTTSVMRQRPLVYLAMVLVAILLLVATIDFYLV